jgi:hypothetical protein
MRRSFPVTSRKELSPMIDKIFEKFLMKCWEEVKEQKIEGTKDKQV